MLLCDSKVTLPLRSWLEVSSTNLVFLMALTIRWPSECSGGPSARPPPPGLTPPIRTSGQCQPSSQHHTGQTTIKTLAVPGRRGRKTAPYHQQQKSKGLTTRHSEAKTSRGKEDSTYSELHHSMADRIKVECIIGWLVGHWAAGRGDWAKQR